MSIKHGLTLGKFAPFHKGHQYLIETALLEMDEVTVIIYDSSQITSIPLSVRANWIRKIYPDVNIIEVWDGPEEVGNTPEIKKKHEDYILNHLKLKGITHFYSSEFYGDHMSLALNAVNRVVDASRKNVPISASTIRQEPFTYREYLHPLVYRDMILNVVFLGAPSTGKTTIAQKLAQEYNTIWMPEFGREYWEKNHQNRRLSLEQLVEVAENHLNHEETRLLQANHVMFTDTNAITTYMFSLYYYHKALPRLIDLANQAAGRYDLVFLCGIDIPYDDTWDRSGVTNRRIFQKQIIDDLTIRKIPFFILQGNLQTRIANVKTILERYQKYANVADLFFIRNTRTPDKR